MSDTRWHPKTCQHRWETVGTDGLDGRSDLNWCVTCGSLKGVSGITLSDPPSRAEGPEVAVSEAHST